MLLLLLLFTGGLMPVLAHDPSPALAHSSSVEFNIQQTVELRAVFEGDRPMDNAQVTIYSPADPATPWQTGTTDEQGHFRFTPDQPGNWDVKVRQAGHGTLITIPIDTEGEAVTTVAEAGVATHSPLQKTMMAIATVWGFIGTALFFTRKPTDP
ncbi:carboxypeptidase-like regulatory domain-containing protein [Spirulina sp. CCNP1310]|nr:carboxypeptidase-like regulatory domain-containing protein [Spirulina sp. CCNP1310]